VCVYRSVAALGSRRSSVGRRRRARRSRGDPTMETTTEEERISVGALIDDLKVREREREREDARRGDRDG